jgi:hypothetical protein
MVHPGGPGPSFAGIHQPMDEPPHLQPMVNVEKPLNEVSCPPQSMIGNKTMLSDHYSDEPGKYSTAPN